jgi:hypothetical protein
MVATELIGEKLNQRDPDVVFLQGIHRRLRHAMIGNYVVQRGNRNDPRQAAPVKLG